MPHPSQVRDDHELAVLIQMIGAMNVERPSCSERSIGQGDCEELLEQLVHVDRESGHGPLSDTDIETDSLQDCTGLARPSAL